MYHFTNYDRLCSIYRLTYKLSWFVLPLVDEVLEGLSHGVEELVVSLEAGADHVIQLFLELE